MWLISEIVRKHGLLHNYLILVHRNFISEALPHPSNLPINFLTNKYFGHGPNHKKTASGLPVSNWESLGGEDTLKNVQQSREISENSQSLLDSLQQELAWPGNGACFTKKETGDWNHWDTSSDEGVTECIQLQQVGLWDTTDDSWKRH